MATTRAAESDDPVLSAALQEMEGALNPAEAGTTSDGSAASEADSKTAETPAGTETTPGGAETDAAKPESGEKPEADKASAPATDTGEPTEPRATADDPLAGTTPFVFSVDGKDETYPAILLADGGAIIPPEKLGEVRTYFEQATTTAREAAALRDYAGQLAQTIQGQRHEIGEETYEGRSAFAALQAEREAMLAGSKHVIAALADPEFVKALGFAYQEEDQAGAKALLDRVVREAGYAHDRTQFDALRKIERDTKTEAQTAEEARTADGALGTAIDTLMRHPTLAALLPEDRAAALTQFGPFRSQLIRHASAADAAQSSGAVKVGELVVDYPMMHAWFLDRQAMREREKASRTDADTKAKAAEDAGKKNAATKGARQPQKTAKAQPVAAKAADAPRSRDAQWDEPLAAALEELGIAQ